MTRRISPQFILVVGLVCATFAGALWAFGSTVTNRRTILAEADTIAKSEPVREEFASQIADALAPHDALAGNPVDINRANDLARQAVETPQFVQAFTAALPNIYSRLVDGTPGDIVLDPGLIGQAAAAVGAQLPSGFTAHVSAVDVPDLRHSLDMMRRASLALGLAGMVLVGLALTWSDHRGRSVMRIGRWLVTVGVITILVFWLLPTVALLPLGGWISVIGIVLATGDWLAVPAALMAALGVTIVVIGRAGEAETRRRNLEVIPTATRPRTS
ncbi:MAG: hypothetical protein ACXVJ7_10950 [Acidimicrobiia bacterium]